MNGIMSERINGLKQQIKNKGQGVVEFALLCAFCAAIGIFASDVDFSGAFEESLDKSKPVLYAAEIGRRQRNNYMEYYRAMRYQTAATIKSEMDNPERIQADQKALVKIAETYLGKTESQVMNLMDFFSNSDNVNKAPEYIARLKGPADGTGFSAGVLVPMSYKNNSLDENGGSADNRTQGWVHYERNNNQNTAMYLTNNEARVYDKYDADNPNYLKDKNRNTICTDRLFFSDDMLDNTGGRVTVRLHYTDGKVDFVDIALRTGNGNSWVGDSATIAEGLCLHVTEAGHTQIENPGSGSSDIINNPQLKDKKGNPVYYNSSLW